jgi:hypothetical protein
VIENGRLFLTKLRDSIRDQTARSAQLMGELESDTREIQLQPQDNMLAVFYEDFSAAVAGTGRLTCKGEEGRNAVELANAMILSSMRREAVSLPLDRAAYSELVEKMVNQELQVV